MLSSERRNQRYWHTARMANARVRQNARLRYENFMEAWIAFSDVCVTRSESLVGGVGKKLGRMALESPLIEPESKALVRLTLGLLLAVFTWILVSCQTAPRTPSKRPRQNTEAPVVRGEKRPETLWLKRETLRIKPKDQGSTTGSIWADAASPRHLLADERPTREGEVVTVLIPEELRFQPPNALPGNPKPGDTKPWAAKPGGPQTATAGANAGANAGATAGANAGGPQDGPPFTDPYAVGAAAELPRTPLTQLKMEIVGREPTGETYLRGVKSYRNGLGELRDVTVFAKIPDRLVTGFEIDARDLTEVAVNEQVNGQTAEYASTGWDPIVSRRLAGYTPDVNAEVQALEDVRQELVMAQGAMKEQMKAMADERSRVQKDRQRNFDETERLKTALSQRAAGEGNPQAAETVGGTGSPAAGATARGAPAMTGAANGANAVGAAGNEAASSARNAASAVPAATQEAAK